VQSYQSVISPSGFEIGGDLALSQVVNASLYYILSSIRSDWDFSLSPGGLASNSYNGHVFWDAETWMYPPLLILHPEIAASMIRYRFNTRNGAIDKALSYKSNYKGTMFAWESAFTGQETCPLSAPTGQLEQHISADVAFAVIQYWRMSGDIFWLKNVGYSLLEGICEFYASRVEKDANNESFSINGVIPPDEYAVHKNNSAYTNAGVKIIMSETTKIAKLLQIQSPAEWSDIAENLVVPSDEKQNIHLEYDGYKGEQIKQADVILLGFPWEFPMSDSRKRSDLDFYMNVTDSENGPAMTWGMAMVGYLSLGDSPKQVEDLFKKSYLNVQGDFNVWFEVPYGGAVNFITGAGGFLQTIPFGWAGMRIYDDNLSFNPQLAPSTDSMKLRGVAYQGSRFNVEWNQETVTINSIDDQKFKVKANNKEYVLKGGKDLTFARSSFSVSSLNDNVFI
jgi:trehalose/maltose hydrolase-like predicted phosphorylase